MEEQEIFNTFKDNFKKNQDSLPYNFNVLDEQCGHIVENSHTNMLIKLLQYKNQYGYIFLRDFLAFLGIGITIDDSRKVVFEREAAYKDGRIDGLIYQQDTFALIIENKINGAGNQEKQISRYIENVCNDNQIFTNKPEQNVQKAWVIFLTKDGFEKPDKESLDCMMEAGIICNAEEPEGPRYFAVNYRDHILPWLKENIQPSVMQKELSLNSGLLQYIDFLEGMLGVRASDDKFIEEQKTWLRGKLGLENKDFSERNKCLQELKSSLNDSSKTEGGKQNEDETLNRQVINAMTKIVEELNEEPFAEFIDITRRYFVEERKLMKDCSFLHDFRYSFLLFRDNHWPKSIHFEWLGTKKLCFHVEMPQKVCELFGRDDFTQLLKKAGFEEDNRRSSTFSFKNKKESKKSILNMKGEELKSFLTGVYNDIDEDLINKINEILTKIR